VKVATEHFQSFIRDVEAGLIRLNVSQTFSLNQIVEAHRLMESNAASGKIVVLP
jgi:NADPH:quinone reductase